MKKLLLVGLLFASTVSAQTFTCNDYTRYQGIGDQYEQIGKGSASKENIKITITVTEPVIALNIEPQRSSDVNKGIVSTEYWKDYNTYRSDSGDIKQNGNQFTVRTALADPMSANYIPIKIVYQCK